MEDIDSSRPWRVWAPAAAGMALIGALAVHAVTLGAYFFEDDVQWLLGGWTWPWARLISLEGRDHFYRPVIELYFMIQTRAWGASAGAFHLANVLLHALNGILVFVLALRIFGRPVPAWVAASLFVLHPRTVEMVAWISGVTGLLMTTFVLLVLILLPAIGFCLVVADLLRRLAAQRRLAPAGVVLAIVAFVFLGGRSTHYGRRAVRDAASRSERYREYVSSCRAAHPQLARGAVVEVPAPAPDGPKRLYVEPLLRVACGDPGLQVRVTDTGADAPRGSVLPPAAAR